MGVPLAWRNLLHERSKLILSVGGIAVALMLIVLLAGFRDGMYATMTAYYDNLHADLIVAQSDTSLASSTIPVALHDELVSISGAVETEHAVVAGVIFTRGGLKVPTALVGYNPATGFGGPWKLAEGRGVQNNNEIVLDAQLAQESKLAVGDNAELLGQAFTIVGLTRETNSWIGYYTFIARSSAEKLLGLSNMTSFYALRLPAGANAMTVARAIEAQVAGVKVVSPARLALNARRSVGSVLDSTLNAVLLVSIVIGIAVMGLTAYTAVIDRMREYGALKAIGADGRRLARLVVSETLYRAAMGLVLGIALSYLVSGMLTSFVPRWAVLIRPETLLNTGLAVLVMSVFAAMLPVRRVAAIDPAVVFKA